jgi:serine/threonine protein kinase
VKRAEHISSGELVAIKIMEKSLCANMKFINQEVIAHIFSFCRIESSYHVQDLPYNFLLQICALGQINHPNCVTLLEVLESPSKLYLVTEL